MYAQQSHDQMCDVRWPMHTEIMFALFRDNFRIYYATDPFNLFIAIGTVLINQYLFPGVVVDLLIQFRLLRQKFDVSLFHSGCILSSGMY